MFPPFFGHTSVYVFLCLVVVVIDANMFGELVPILKIREIAPSLPGEKDFPARSRHLLKDGYLSPATGGKSLGGTVCGHQAGGASANYKNV